MGLLIDMPKPQSGNTNDGNTARRFFRDYEKSAQITGVNQELIKNFKIIAEVLNLDFKIKLDKFELHLKKTRELYLNLYSWYPMSPTLHKILFHGREIIQNCLIPPGQGSETPAELLNKQNRHDREFLTRKTSRVACTTDLIHRRLFYSDPLIVNYRAPPATRRGKIMHEVLELLDEPSGIQETGDESESE